VRTPVLLLGVYTYGFEEFLEAEIFDFLCSIRGFVKFFELGELTIPAWSLSSGMEPGYEQLNF
jgi:hypothetical protein